MTSWHKRYGRCIISHLTSFIHSFIPMITSSTTPSLSSAAYLRIKRKHHGGGGGAVPRGQVPANSPGHGPPLTHLCHFLFQNFPLWWLKAKRLWLPRSCSSLPWTPDLSPSRHPPAFLFSLFMLFFTPPFPVALTWHQSSGKWQRNNKGCTNQILLPKDTGLVGCGSSFDFPGRDGAGYRQKNEMEEKFTDTLFCLWYMACPFITEPIYQVIDETPTL